MLEPGESLFQYTIVFSATSVEHAIEKSNEIDRLIGDKYNYGCDLRQNVPAIKSIGSV